MPNGGHSAGGRRSRRAWRPISRSRYEQARQKTSRPGPATATGVTLGLAVSIGGRFSPVLGHREAQGIAAVFTSVACARARDDTGEIPARSGDAREGAALEGHGNAR